METIPNDFRKRDIITRNRDETITSTTFSKYPSTNPFYNVCKSVFLKNYPNEVITGMDIGFTDGQNFVHHQISYKYIGDGIKPRSFSMNFDDHTLFDDGDGNLIEDGDTDEIVVGNIFYKSGNIFLYDYTLFDTIKELHDIINDSVVMTYKRPVFFIQNKIYIQIDKDEYNKSTNSTFDESGAPYPFISSIYLYNEEEELMAKAQFSKPIPTDTDLFIILDDLETL